MATILTFSTQGNPRRAVPRPDARTEVIVFPRTDIRALRRLSEMSPDAPPAAAPGDDGPA